MGGVIGAMSAKLAVTAGMVLFTARVGTHSAAATLNPSLPTSQVSVTFARTIRLAGDDGKARAIGIDHSEMRVRALDMRDDTPPPIVIGADVLRRVSLLLDFRARRLRVMETSEARRAAARMTALDAIPTTDGCFAFAARDADNRPIKVALAEAADLQSPALSIRLGGATLAVHKPAAGSRCSAEDAVIDWQSFADRRIVVDLGQGKLWL